MTTQQNIYKNKTKQQVVQQLRKWAVGDLCENINTGSSLRKEVQRLTQKLLQTHDKPKNDVELLGWIAENAWQTDTLPEPMSYSYGQQSVVPKWQYTQFGPTSTSSDPVLGVSIGHRSCVISIMRNHLPQLIAKDFSGKTTRQQFAFLKEKSQDYFAGKSQIVATVPAYFQDKQRMEIKNLACEAGFEVLRIINEPTAALLYHQFHKHNEKKVLVIDWGAKFCDFSVLYVEDSIFEVLLSETLAIGGDEIDNIILNWVKNQLHGQHNVRLEEIPGAITYIHQQIHQAKHDLSQQKTTRIYLGQTTLGQKIINLEIVLTRSILENLISELLEQIQKRCLEIQEQHLKIDHVVLAGGSTVIPCFQKMIQDTFLCDITCEMPQECVSLGAAIQGEILTGTISSILLGEDLPLPVPPESTRTKSTHTESIRIVSPSQYAKPMRQSATTNVLLLDVTPLSLRIEWDDQAQVVIPRNTTIPTRKQQGFQTTKKHKELELRIFQGESPEIERNLVLGKIRLKNLKKNQTLSVEFDIDANGVITVSVRENNTVIAKQNIAPRTLSHEQVENLLKQQLQTEQQSVVEEVEKVKEEKKTLSQKYFFEKILSDDAGKPGPVERMLAQSRKILRKLQNVFDLYSVTIIHILDVFVDAVVSYITGIYESWKLYKTLQRRLQLGTPQQQLQELKQNFCHSRYLFARIFRFVGIHGEEIPTEWSDFFMKPQDFFPLELVLEMRRMLDDMKRDLDFVTYQQTIEFAKQGILKFFFSFIPNPLEMFTRFKDCLVMLFAMQYSRGDIEKMYQEFVQSYCQIGSILSRECEAKWAQSEAKFWQLLSYEQYLQSNLDWQQEEDLKTAIENSKNNIQKLQQMLFVCHRFRNVQNWQRLDLLKEISKMRQWQSHHASALLEWENWLTNQLREIWSQKRFGLTPQEQQLRIQEQQKLHLRRKIDNYLLQKCW